MTPGGKRRSPSTSGHPHKVGSPACMPACLPVRPPARPPACLSCQSHTALTLPSLAVAVTVGRTVLEHEWAFFVVRTEPAWPLPLEEQGGGGVELKLRVSYEGAITLQVGFTKSSKPPWYLPLVLTGG